MTTPDTDTLAGLLAECTPGPWRLDNGDNRLGGGYSACAPTPEGPRWPTQNATGEYCMALPPPHGKGQKNVQKANATLIALAPELAAEVIALRAQAAKDKARIERLEAALRLLALRSESLVHAHRHGQGLEGWYNTVDGVDRAVTSARAALEDGE